MEMTEDEFKRAHRRMAARARENFFQDGVVHGALLIYGNVSPDPITCLQVDPDTTEAEARDMLHQHGVFACRGPFRQNVDTIREVVTSVEGYAATLLMETWIVEQESARETLRMGIRPSEHPMRDEALVFISLWPGQQRRHLTMDRILRDKVGSGLRLEANTDIGMSADETQNAFAGWLTEVLPSETF